MKSEKIPGLYIHIPFCLSKCPYCDFYSSTSLSAFPHFLEGLFKEMEGYRGQFTPFDTIYIGGGTPSLLNPQQLESILVKARTSFEFLSNSERTPEVTIETNPADLNKVFLQSMRAIGINRINIGVQSFDDGVLHFLGRRHSTEQAVSAIEASRDAGFSNLGLDLIYAVPGQNLYSWLDTLRKAIAFSPEHLSCYQLTLEAETRLGMRYRAGEFSIPGEELQYQFFVKTSEFLENAGYLHYEVSNFARGREYTSRHNQKYWDHSPYLGLGPAAHSFRSNRRWWNPRSLERYLSAIGTGNLPLEDAETLTGDQLRLEAIYLGLRTKKGIDLRDFKDRHQYDLLAEKKETLSVLLENRLLTLQDGVLFPTREGLGVADRLALI